MSLEISSLTTVSFRIVLFNLHVFWDFPEIFPLLISSLIPLGFESIHCMIPSLLILLRCVYGPKRVVPRCMLHASLRRTCLLLLLKQSVCVDCMWLVGAVAEFSCVLADFLPAGFVHF